MTIRELITALEAQAQEHGDDTIVTISGEYGIDEIEKDKIGFEPKGAYYGTVWADMVTFW